VWQPTNGEADVAADGVEGGARRTAAMARAPTQKQKNKEQKQDLPMLGGQLESKMARRP
jgi:hypothetical protein